MEILTFVLIALLQALGGYFLGLSHGRKYGSPTPGALSQEEAQEMVNAYIRSRINHPAMRDRHPETD